MPELPEVETIVQQLKKHVVGKRILSATVLEKTRADAAIETIMPCTIVQAWRRAKADCAGCCPIPVVPVISNQLHQAIRNSLCHETRLLTTAEYAAAVGIVHQLNCWTLARHGRLFYRRY